MKIEPENELEKEKLMEEIVIGPEGKLRKIINRFFKINKESVSILGKYNPTLAKSIRRITLFQKSRIGKFTPRVERMLLEIGRPDIVYGPERLAEYLHRMDKEGLPVSKLSPYVWQCTKAIDALSDSQLYELCTQGNAAALDVLRNTIVNNPWLLIGNKNPDGPYKARRGTGISKFVLKSMFELTPDLAQDFFIQAREIMPSQVYKDWTEELLMKYTGDDILGWDVSVFIPEIKDEYKELYEINKLTGEIIHKDTGKSLNSTDPQHLETIKKIIDPNCLFMLITSHVDPVHLGIYPPEGPLAEKRKPLITHYILANQGLFRKYETRKYLKLLEEKIYGEKKEIFEKKYQELENFYQQIERNLNYLDKEKIAQEIVEKLNNLEIIATEINEQEIKDKFEKLKNEFKNLLNIEEINLNEEDPFDIKRCSPINIKVSEGFGNYKIKKIVSPGWIIKIDGGEKVIQKALVEIEKA